MRAVLLLLFALPAIVACGKDPRPEPVVVYITQDFESDLPARLRSFTDESGIRITLRSGDSGANTNDVIANRGSPPADILITSNVADIWRAADEGALRPITTFSEHSVPASLRDPDGMWAALDYGLLVIATAREQSAEAALPHTYADLGKDDYRNQLCLTSSSLPPNRALIAMLIDETGVRPAELLVRRWMRNLALPPFASQAALLSALQSGTCQYAIVSDRDAGAVTTIVPDKTYFDIRGVGIARHARYPESAQKLVSWLLADIGLQSALSASEKNVSVAGWRAEEAERLAERAGYR